MCIRANNMTGGMLPSTQRLAPQRERKARTFSFLPSLTLLQSFALDTELCDKGRCPIREERRRGCTMGAGEDQWSPEYEPHTYSWPPLSVDPAFLLPCPPSCLLLLQLCPPESCIPFRDSKAGQGGGQVRRKVIKVGHHHRRCSSSSFGLASGGKKTMGERCCRPLPPDGVVRLESEPRNQVEAECAVLSSRLPLASTFLTHFSSRESW